jgi:phosphopantetheinyl transferase
MALFKEWEPDEHSLAAIWKIEEPEAFFVAQTGIQSDIKSEKRRLERLAGRFLLQFLKEDFPLHHIYADAQDKPRIPDDRYYFSISHSYPYVAAMISDKTECGIDVQVWHARMQALQNKFLSEREQQFFQNDTHLITLAWDAKEAAYKWLGQRGIDFIQHLPIHSFKELDGYYFFELMAGLPGQARRLSVEAFLTDDFGLAFTTK